MMWVFGYIICLARKHIFAAVNLQDLPYQYCLRCGKLEPQHVTEYQSRSGRG